MNNFRLWIDAVGGYLVCPGSHVRLGQWMPAGSSSGSTAPTTNGEVDIALLADLAPHHATLVRHDEGYLIEAKKPVWVDDRQVSGRALLRDGNRVQLGRNVRLRFRQPTALSGSAVLELASRHRTQPAINSIILLAETCLLGPTAACHIVCPQWQKQVVLQRHGNDLYCVTQGDFCVAGKNYSGRAKLPWGELVAGDDFSFNTELI
jgi:hypothetical protein